jgi:hypothetical protein
VDLVDSVFDVSMNFLNMLNGSSRAFTPAWYSSVQKTGLDFDHSQFINFKQILRLKANLTWENLALWNHHARPKNMRQKVTETKHHATQNPATLESRRRKIHFFSKSNDINITQWQNPARSKSRRSKINLVSKSRDINVMQWRIPTRSTSVMES